MDIKIYTLEKDNFADLAHFYHSVLEMGQVLLLEYPLHLGITFSITNLNQYIKKIKIYLIKLRDKNLAHSLFIFI